MGKDSAADAAGANPQKGSAVQIKLQAYENEVKRLRALVCGCPPFPLHMLMIARPTNQ